MESRILEVQIPGSSQPLGNPGIHHGSQAMITGIHFFFCVISRASQGVMGLMGRVWRNRDIIGSMQDQGLERSRFFEVPGDKFGLQPPRNRHQPAEQFLMRKGSDISKVRPLGVTNQGSFPGSPPFRLLDRCQCFRKPIRTLVQGLLKLFRSSIVEIPRASDPNGAFTSNLEGVGSGGNNKMNRERHQSWPEGDEDFRGVSHPVAKDDQGSLGVWPRANPDRRPVGERDVYFLPRESALVHGTIISTLPRKWSPSWGAGRAKPRPRSSC